jgi:thioredoxin-like negative regulator of GroEL
MHMIQLNRFAAAVAVAGAVQVSLLAQAPQATTLPPAAIPTVEAAALAQYWTLIAQGRYEDAAKTVGSVLSRYPRNMAVLSLVVETTIARAGATGALDVYESWLGRRTMEEPGVLRRIARAFLYEWGRQTGNAATRTEALVALANDGDADAQAVLAAGVGTDVALATLGNAAAVHRLSTRLKSAEGLKLREIQLLAETGSREAVAPLAGVLTNPRPENRAAAAEALGKLGSAEAVAPLKPLLQDPHGAVRIAAAGALFRLGDPSGATLLEELAASEHAGVRRSAAILMASRPDGAWKALVRGLASDADPSIRLDAARLLAPHDPELARSILDSLATDSNLAIREEAELALADTSGSDFAVLRRVLRTGNGKAKVRAADRVLALSR